jgi:diguanylate cyclase (GGDEF)-like protein
MAPGVELYELHRLYTPDVCVVYEHIQHPDLWMACGRIKAERTGTEGASAFLWIVPNEVEAGALTAATLHGADDLCAHGRISQELIPRIRHLARLNRLNATLQLAHRKLTQANQELKLLSMTDELTGLYNMRYFHHRLLQEFSRATRYRSLLAMVMCDVDDFKQVNDTCGHIMGSYVLAQLGSLIKESIRCDDVAARFGGDEFVMLLPETTLEGASTLAERLLESVRGHRFQQDGHTIQVTLSLGVVAYDPRRDHVPVYEHASMLLKAADQLLYLAKAQGKNRAATSPQSITDPAPL